MGKYKIIFSDIDGTLLNSQHQITEATRKELCRIQQKGIPFVLISSRMPSSVAAIQKEVGITGPLIAYGGSLILDVSGIPVYSAGLSANEAALIGKYIETVFPSIAWNMYADDRWMCPLAPHPRVLQEEKIIGRKALRGTLSDLESWSYVHKILCMGEPSAITSLEHALRSAHPALTLVQSAPFYLEITRADITKGAAVSRLCRHLGIPLEASLAFGDNYNDLDMLRQAGEAVVMGNAPAGIRSQFSFITQTNDQDGVALALRRLFPT